MEPESGLIYRRTTMLPAEDSPSIMLVEESWDVPSIIEENKRLRQERAKWLPLWEAVKELALYDDFSRDEPTKFDGTHSGVREGLTKFKNLWEGNQHSIRLARRELYKAILELRVQGEK